MKNLIWSGECKKPGSPRGGKYYVFQCLFCQKPFVSPGYEVNAGKMTKYCSNECQMFSEKRIDNVKKALAKINTSGINNPNYKNGSCMYRQFLKDKCELCNRLNIDFMRIGNNRKRSPLIVHHVDNDRNNGNQNNLKTVCYSCHMRIHNPSYFGKYPDFQKW
jgi:hypothetical protein